MLSLNGQVVKQLANTVLSPGEYAFSFDVRDVPQGMYFISVEGNGSAEVLKLVVSK